MNNGNSIFEKVFSYGLMLLIVVVRRIRFWCKISHQKNFPSIQIDWKQINHNRIEFVNRIATKIQAINYLEIGAANNLLFDSVICNVKVGVDPHKGGTERVTSDFFFSKNTSNFDLIFVDGLHTYEQIVKDVNNSLKILNSGGYVILHDMFPRNWKECFMPAVTLGDWTGDVWKLAFSDFENLGLSFSLLRVDHGIGIISKKTQQNCEVPFDYDLDKKDFSYFYSNYQNLNILDWHDLNILLND